MLSVAPEATLPGMLCRSGGSGGLRHSSSFTTHVGFRELNLKDDAGFKTSEKLTRDLRENILMDLPLEGRGKFACTPMEDALEQ